MSYTLTYLGCAVIFASFGNIIGRRNAYLVAFAIFTAFSVGCGFAQTLEQLIALRSLQGLGGSALYSLTMVIFPEIFPISKVKHLGAIIGAVIIVGGALGPILGGIITHYTTWRWIFWMNGPTGFVFALLFWACWPPPHQLRPLRRQKFMELDFVGCLLLIAASVLFVFAFQQAGVRAGSWDSAIVIAPLVFGLICWGLLFGWEALVSRRWSDSIHAIFPIRLLTNRVYIGGVISTMLWGFLFFTVLFSLPQRFQVVNGQTQLLAGVGLLPLLCSSALGSFVAGAVNSKKNLTFYTFLIGGSLLLLGAGLLTTLASTKAVEAKTYGFQVFFGLGFGITAASIGISSAVQVNLRDSAVAQGIVAQARILGGSIGIATATVILATTEIRDLSGLVTEGQLASLQSEANSLSPQQLQAVRQAYADSFTEELRICAGIAALALITTLMTFERHPRSMQELRQQQIKDDDERNRELEAKEGEKRQPAVSPGAPA